VQQALYVSVQADAAEVASTTKYTMAERIQELAELPQQFVKEGTQVSRFALSRLRVAD
jgi:hypothetical protein